ncbi:MAG: DNA-protecting protein DprA, partial [Rhodospirillaceae bacterium]|nr:DNA-protecting protein DprA [Rhodospirillaceae bacterium]
MSEDAPKSLTRDGLVDWLRLSATEGIGPITFRQLIAKHGSATAALANLPTKGKIGAAPTADRMERELLAA